MIKRQTLHNLYKQQTHSRLSFIIILYLLVSFPTPSLTLIQWGRNLGTKLPWIITTLCYYTLNYNMYSQFILTFSPLCTLMTGSSCKSSSSSAILLIVFMEFTCNYGNANIPVLTLFNVYWKLHRYYFVFNSINFPMKWPVTKVTKTEYLW